MSGELRAPDVAPGLVVFESPDTRVIRMLEGTGLRIDAEYAISDLIAEDCRSLVESADYIVRFREMSDPITCECCGTLVGQCPEAEYRGDPPRTWRPGIWESATGRRHTLRRCNWLRATGDQIRVYGAAWHR